MPRHKRRTVPGIAYHLISRFVDRDWFISTNLERANYLKWLGKAIARSDWKCLAYAIMSNHIHLAVVAGEDRLDSWVRRAHAPFADWMNRTHKRIGVLFVRGPKDLIIPNDRVGHVVAYIHNNPVRASVVSSARESAWTSHRAYAGLDPAPRWLSVDEGLLRAGFAERSSFDSWVSSAPCHPCLKQSAVTNEDDEEQLLQAYELQEADATRRETSSRISALDIVYVAADELCTPVSQLLSKRRSRQEVLVRAAVVRCGEVYGHSDVSIAAALVLSQQAVSALRRREAASPDVAHAASRVLRRLEAIATRTSSAKKVIHTS
jgi:REP element-mobilizing transposase RayT